MNPLLSLGMQVFPVFCEMQQNGMPASRSYFERLHVELSDLKSTIAGEISQRYYHGRPYNPNSRPQTSTICRLLGIEPKEKTPGGQLSTSKDSLEHLRYTTDTNSSNYFIKLLFDWREVEKQDSFCRQLLECTDPRGPDIQNVVGDLLWATTHTRRISMKKVGGKGPSLLTIPKRQRLGMLEGLSKKVRGGFIAPEGYSIGSYDLSQVEMRIIAHFAYTLGNDKSMLDVFASGVDFHSMTAARMFGIDIDDVDQNLHRIPAKTTGFGVGYGQTAPALRDEFAKQGIEKSIRDCQNFIDGFNLAYPGVPISKCHIITGCKKNGYVETLRGMRRYLPGVRSSQKFTRLESERKAYSHVVQGTAQDVIQGGCISFYHKVNDMRRRGIDVKLRLQFHDEVIVTFPEQYVEEVSNHAIDCLSNHHGVELSIDIEADGDVGRKWSEL